jgi:endo-1,4-beta-xylanase
VPYVFPGEGDALLWFEDFSLHPAYYGVLAALKNATGLCDKKQDKRAFVFNA